MFDWVNRNKHGAKLMRDSLNIKNISSAVEKLLAIATSNSAVVVWLYCNNKEAQ
jgi:hypothetical protein